jgi:hypothetical protein
MAVEMKKPAKLRFPWPPTDADYAKEVLLQDNWGTLAALAGRTDPWDIIRFNFDTTDPHEVNWYLSNWVGCNVASADGKNWRFGTTQIGKKLLIYIPRPGWYPTGTSPDSAAVQAVMKILHSVQCMKIGFDLDGMRILPGELGVVVNNLIINNLGVRVVPQLRSSVQYRAFPRDGLPADIFAVRAAEFPTLLAQSLLVHEAVHALDDIQKRLTPRAKREAKAFIAQLLFIRYMRGPYNYRHPIYKAAEEIAFCLRVNRPVNGDDLVKLYAAIQAAPPDQFGTGVAAFDGV